MQKSFSRRFKRPILALYRLQQQWVDIVGAPLAEHTEPVNIIYSCLKIRVAGSGFAQHLRMMEADILTALRENGFSKIKKISFEQGKIEKSSASSQHEPKEKRAAWVARTRTQDDRSLHEVLQATWKKRQNI